MAGIGAITLDNAGAVTAPTGLLPFDLPGHESTLLHPTALASFALMPGEGGIMWANGVDPVRHYVGAVMGTGLLAPNVAPTVAPTGTRATVRLDTDNGGAYAIADGDYIQMIFAAPGEALQGRITFRTALSAYPINSEVLIGGSTAQALTNLKAFTNQTGVEGTAYYTFYNLSDLVEATTLTATDLSFRARDYGTPANAWPVSLSGGWTGRWEEEAANVAATTFTGGADGSGTAPGAGTYLYAYAYTRRDGAVSGLSPSTETGTTAAMNIDLSALAQPADGTVHYIRVYRTTAGGGLFYRVDENDYNDSTFTDTVSDDTMTAFGAVAFDERLFRTYRAGVVPKVRYLARFQGRWFGAGALLAAEYKSGTAAVTQGDETVTITGGYPRTSWVGRTFRIDAYSETYTIMSVDEAAGTFELDRDWEAASDSGETYTVRDLRDPYEIYWSEPGLPNNWPVTNSLKGVQSDDALGVTGLFAAFGDLIVFTRNGMWRLFGSDGSYQIAQVSSRAGCLSGQTIVMDGERMYWIGPEGVYGWAGSGEPVNLSSPEADGTTRGIDGTIARLTMGAAHRAVGHYCQSESEVRFYVPLDGERENRYCLVLDTQTGAFSLDTCEDVTWAGTLPGANGDDAEVQGDIAGLIRQTDVSNSDGAYGFEPTQSVASSTARTVSVSGTPFTTALNGLAGVPVWHVSADGTFTRATVASNTSAVLTYRRYMTAPSASTQFSTGGILMWLQTGRCDYGDRRGQKIVPGYTVAHAPEADGQYFFFFSYGQGDFAIPTVGWTAGDLTVGNTANDHGPRRRFRCRKEAVLHGWGICAVEPGCDPAFGGVTVEIRSRDELDL